ncbi:ATP-dependent endonuclease [Bacillus wiedmannii]|uniref:AAA family ATPase n=1 Tax=Bacillus wiedmannii TaxID=1890302 RepID=UPI000BEF6C56|nr:AAA family ATPase [Bacillus wiedmannii]PEL39452.1 ATP-dependent endonuclease [Bacillus wiedmannii]PHE07098.1 ATP-dependent endonuclease [Bacillus wiedmannii]
MLLKEIIIKNYRKFKNESFSMADDITLLAGANNSGKTSMINLMGSIMQSGKTPFCISDIPVKLSKKWVDEVYEIFVRCFDKDEDVLSTVEMIVNELFGDELSSLKGDLIIPATLMRFKIEYTETDDIRKFADFIMDLDPDNKNFYFEYSFQPTRKSFREALEDNYNKLYARYNKIQSLEDPSLKVQQFKEVILSIYEASIIEKCYFSDGNYIDKVEIEVSTFRRLFNYKYINAGRPLDDQSNGNFKSLSKNMIELATHNSNLNALLEDLPDQILSPIQDARVIDEVRVASVRDLSDTVNTISKASGGNTGSMILDIDINEETITSLLNQITNTKYQYEDYVLDESSQGLGYSNMIYILLQLETYKRKIDPLVVNLFVIEEPESHMHPQMQRIFGKHLKKYYLQKKIQGLITTHSGEMVRLTEMKNLRVSRPLNHLESKIYDFSIFKESLSGDATLDTFYDWFYEIGFSEIVFADRVILYEGDTERLLIRKLLTLDTYEELNQKYIAYVQVGGAYAHKYSKVIDFLKIKTLILTDLDYKKGAVTVEAVKKSNTTNATINSYYDDSKGKDSPTVLDLYKWKENGENNMFGGLALLSYQGQAEQYARTLEEAMLSKFYNFNVLEKKDRAFWIQRRNIDKLKYVVPNPVKPNEDNPNPDNKYSIRDIVKHTENRKTDFMYSVILNGLIEKMLPSYIEEGLDWLQK